jgi:hypothetical protein
MLALTTIASGLKRRLCGDAPINHFVLYLRPAALAIGMTGLFGPFADRGHRHPNVKLEGK